jgi:hypothetical protein
MEDEHLSNAHVSTHRSANGISRKFCQFCEKEIFGRSDKRFCNYSCRNAFNNEKYRYEYVYKIINQLKLNRKILLHLCPEGKVIHSRTKLLKMGFSFSCFTGIYKTKSSGALYYQCFEIGFRKNPKNLNQYIIVNFNFS